MKKTKEDKLIKTEISENNDNKEKRKIITSKKRENNYFSLIKINRL